MGKIECPFIRTNELEKRGVCKLSCEHGKLTFHDKDSMRLFIKKYCGSVYGWKECSLAESLMERK